MPRRGADRRAGPRYVAGRSLPLEGQA